MSNEPTTCGVPCEIERRAEARFGQRAVCRGDEIGSGVRQRPVEIENRNPHRQLPRAARRAPLLSRIPVGN